MMKVTCAKCGQETESQPATGQTFYHDIDFEVYECVHCGYKSFEIPESYGERIQRAIFDIAKSLYPTMQVFNLSLQPMTDETKPKVEIIRKDSE